MAVATTGDNELELTVAGVGGRAETLELVTTLPTPAAEGVRVTKTDTGFRLEIPFEGAGYVRRVVRVKF